MSKLKLTLLSALVAITGIAGTAAARPHLDKQELKEKFDTNKDGKLDDAEKARMVDALGARLEKRRQEVLARFDTNKDGKLDDAERQAMHDQRVTERFKQLDANNDGVVTFAEFKAARARPMVPGLGKDHGRRGHGRGQGHDFDDDGDRGPGPIPGGGRQ